MGRLTLALLILLFPALSFSGVLLEESNLVYIGSFRVPYQNLGGDSTASRPLGTSAAMNNMTYNPANNSIITTTQEYDIVEISIPTLVASETISGLAQASVVQVPGDLTGSTWSNIGEGGVSVSNGGRPGGLLVYNNKLIGSVYGYYTVSAVLSHYTASLTWATSGYQFSGFKQVGYFPGNPAANGSGFVGGWMAHIPSEWQSALGYPVITGQAGLAVLQRTSLGPAAFGFDPDDIGTNDPAPGAYFVAYTEGHPTLGEYESTSLLYNMSCKYRGVVFPSGTDSIMYFGRNGLGQTGLGDPCYGFGTDNEALHNTTFYYEPTDSTERWWYDPTDDDKGTHGYPYEYKVWAYDANDFKDVKDGVKLPWEIVPYDHWNFDIPFQTEHRDLAGVAYDPASQLIYIAQIEIDTTQSAFTSYPIVSVFRINGLTTTPAGVKASGTSIGVKATGTAVSIRE